jgi:hypothetical protein
VDLFVSSNAFTGSLPSELGSLVDLKFLEFSNCKNLGGTVPSEIGVLEYLEALNIIETGITGTIPSSICDPNTVNSIVRTRLKCACCILEMGTAGPNG